MNLQGTYTNIVEIGAGGGGTVFRAFHVRMQKYVVLKKIHDSIKSNVDIRGELNVLKNLRHEYLPTVLDFIEDEGSIYTVMDYIPGESFESLLKRGVRFSQAQVAKYAAQLGQVLVYLHGQKTPIVHGDIKPANIMLTPDDNICLIDFNISQVQDGVISTNMGYTPGYAPPEQVRIVQTMAAYLQEQAMYQTQNVQMQNAQVQNVQAQNAQLQNLPGQGTMLLNGNQQYRNNRMSGAVQMSQRTELLTPGQQQSAYNTPYAQQQGPAMPVLQERMDERSDLYSAGATLYALLCGQAPSADFSVRVPIEALVENCSEGLAHLINKSMEPDPDDRFRNAEEFLKAVTDIAKVNKRYRHLVIRQNLATIFCVFAIAGCALLTVFGREQMKKERVDAYMSIVDEMAELRGKKKVSEDKFNKLYEKAVAEFPDFAAAYYQKAARMYESRKYEELQEFILEDVLSHVDGFSDEETADFYFLLANTCLEREQLKDALTYYRTAVKYNPNDSTYYSEYAIALARSDKLSEAKKILKDAEKKGLANDKILLAEGEISSKQGDMEEAIEYFEECIEETEDDYTLLRAYIMWGKVYDAEADQGSLLTKTEVLEEGLDEVGETDKAVILEQLAQTYIDLQKITGDDTYGRKAIEYLEEVVELGWDGYVTHTNIAVLYQEVGDFDSALEEYEDMISKYGEDYRTYKRLAFLEIDIQAKKENRDRDYDTFVEYYDKTMELFEESGVRRDVDMEIQKLEQAYEQLEEGHWLEDYN